MQKTQHLNAQTKGYKNLRGNQSEHANIKKAFSSCAADTKVVNVDPICKFRPEDNVTKFADTDNKRVETMSL